MDSKNRPFWKTQGPLIALSAVVMVCYIAFKDLRGISTDEGIRIGVMNGLHAFSANPPSIDTSWREVLAANGVTHYQPIYFLLQNSIMRITQTQSMEVLRYTNIFFLGVCLAGILQLSKSWCLWPRLFALGLFSFNAYLFMHVLHIREYVMALTFYVWSSWFVLKLDRRELKNFRTDVGWFLGYGLFLIVGFYVQSWIVFVAIGQFLFLVLQRRPNHRRFYTHLILSYMLVWYATVPYLIANTEKVNVGKWGAEGTNLWAQLSMGFHLILSGHVLNHSTYAELIYWFLAACLLCTVCLIVSPQIPLPRSAKSQEFHKQGRLMVLSSVVALAFQILYFYRIDSLSVWPRYFLIHYFFWIWIIAMGFNYLNGLHAEVKSRWAKRVTRGTMVTLTLITLTSAVAQTRSYSRNPFLDTGLNRIENWNVWSAGFAHFVRPDDILISHDFISRATLTFTHPFTNQVLTLPEVDTADLGSTPRLVYMESVYSVAERETLASRISALGFPRMQVHDLPPAPDGSVTRNWKVLIFTRE